jgi:hypothetical protein
MEYAKSENTYFQLRKVRSFFTEPENWCQGDYANENEARLDVVISMISGDATALEYNMDEGNVYSGGLNRGEISEIAWFIRQAMNKIAPEFGGLIYKWNDAPGRTRQEVLDLIALAINLAITDARLPIINIPGVLARNTMEMPENVVDDDEDGPPIGCLDIGEGEEMLWGPAIEAGWYLHPACMAGCCHSTGPFLSWEAAAEADRIRMKEFAEKANRNRTGDDEKETRFFGEL